MAVSDIYQITIDGLQDDQRIMNVIHYKQTVAVTMEEQELLTRFQANTEGAFLNLMSQEYTLTGYICQKIWPLPILTLFTVDRGNVPGTQAGEALPVNCPIVLSKTTALAGRKNRGRLYLSGVYEDFVDDSKLNAAGIAAMTSLAGALDNALVTAGAGAFIPVVYHRGDHTSTPITKHVVRLPTRNMRRRQLGRGQ